MKPWWHACWLVVAVMGCRSGSGQSAAGSADKLYWRSCATCHGTTGTGIARMGMRTLPADLTAPAVQAKTDEALRRVILEGKGEMPPFRRLLTDDEVRALIAHVRSLRRATP